jgi:hypothetical protein
MLGLLARGRIPANYKRVGTLWSDFFYCTVYPLFWSNPLQSTGYYVYHLSARFTVDIRIDFAEKTKLF